MHIPYTDTHIYIHMYIYMCCMGKSIGVLCILLRLAAHHSRLTHHTSLGCCLPLPAPPGSRPAPWDCLYTCLACLCYKRNI